MVFAVKCKEISTWCNALTGAALWGLVRQGVKFLYTCINHFYGVLRGEGSGVLCCLVCNMQTLLDFYLSMRCWHST